MVLIIGCHLFQRRSVDVFGAVSRIFRFRLCVTERFQRIVWRRRPPLPLEFHNLLCGRIPADGSQGHFVFVSGNGTLLLMHPVLLHVATATGRLRQGR